MNGSERSLIVQTEGSEPRGPREDAYAWTSGNGCRVWRRVCHILMSPEASTPESFGLLCETALVWNSHSSSTKGTWMKSSHTGTTALASAFQCCWSYRHLRGSSMWAMKPSAEHCMAFFKGISKSFGKLGTFHSEGSVLARTDSDSSYRFHFLFQSARIIGEVSTYSNI